MGEIIPGRRILPAVRIRERTGVPRFPWPGSCMGRSAILGARANRGKGRLGRPQRDGNWPPRSANRRKQPAEEPYRAAHATPTPTTPGPTSRPPFPRFNILHMTAGARPDSIQGVLTSRPRSLSNIPAPHVLRFREPASGARPRPAPADGADQSAIHRAPLRVFDRCAHALGVLPSDAAAA